MQNCKKKLDRQGHTVHVYVVDSMERFIVHLVTIRFQFYGPRREEPAEAWKMAS